MRSLAPVALSTVLLIVIWETLTLFFPPYIMPPVTTVLATLWSLTISGELLQNLLPTAARLVGGLFVAFACAFLLGTAMALSGRLAAVARPLINSVIGIPGVCWIILAIVWFADVELRILFTVLVVIVPLWTIQINDGIRGLDHDLVDMIRHFRPSRAQYVRMLIMPGIVPEIVTSWKLMLSFAVRTLILAELVGAQTGIGNRLLRSQEMFDVSKILAWTILISIFIFLLEAALEGLERILLAWRPVSSSETSSVTAEHLAP